MPYKSSDKDTRSIGKSVEVSRNQDLRTVSGLTQVNRWVLIPLTATGGTTYEPGNGYKYHKFTYPNTDNFVVTEAGPGLVDLLVVAGGGSGGNYYGGGGGAGGVVHGVAVPITAMTYPITVGNGGAGVTAPNAGNPGTDSSIGAPGVAIADQPDYILAKGGGAGGSPYNVANGEAGGSGGGDAGGNSPPFGGLATQPTTNPSPLITDHGYPGGWSYPSSGYGPSGGGGAGEQGVNTPGNDTGAGDGGDGVPISGFEYPLIGLSPFEVFSPTNNHYGGGGGAGKFSTPATNRTAAGGVGGGGGYGSPTLPGQNGLGGGGGGGHPPNFSSPTSGLGGEGMVVIRYAV